MPEQEDFDLRDAPPFDVYTWSDYPEVNAAVDALAAELEALYHSRGKQFREKAKAKRYLKVMVMGVWAPAKLGETAWRSINFDTSAYRAGRETRYNKIHLRGRMVTLFKDLIHLGYVELKIGYRDPVTGRRYKTRIRALSKLIGLIDNHGVAELAERVGQVNVLTPMTISPETARPVEPRESIRLKDGDGNLIDYRDTRATNLMRKNLAIINAKIREAHVALRLTDDQFQQMWSVLKGKRQRDFRQYVDFSKTSMHRVFNGSFELGGRFYGGWWEGIPREFRPYIEINHQSTVELDYSGHHVRMLYAQEGLQMPDNPYDLEGFDREDQKTAVMIILNAYEESKALRAIASEGIQNGRELLAMLKERHEPIAKYFHTGVGLELQNKDAKIAESLMLQMIVQSNAVILPIHDSFLVSKGFEQELLEAMNTAFQDEFSSAAKIKAKDTALGLNSVAYDPEVETQLEESKFDLENLNSYGEYLNKFGYYV